MGTLPGQFVEDFPTHLWGDVYIETGLSEGTSMAVALGYKATPFRKLYGVELDVSMVSRAAIRFVGEERLTIYEGSSLDVLPRIIDPDRRTIFWLDAHYDGTKPTSFHPPHGQCVLLGELKIIMAVPWRVWPTILIDDSSTFCSDEWWRRGAHGTGMDRAQNPTFQQIYDAVGAVDNRYDIFIRDQCIYCLPGRK